MKLLILIDFLDSPVNKNYDKHSDMQKHHNSLDQDGQTQCLYLHSAQLKNVGKEIR